MGYEKIENHACNNACFCLFVFLCLCVCFVLFFCCCFFFLLLLLLFFLLFNFRHIYDIDSDEERLYYQDCNRYSKNQTCFDLHQRIQN